MISEHIDHIGLHTPARIQVPNITFGERQLAAIGAMSRKLRVGVTTWIRVPALPYAALWEASLNVSLLEGNTPIDHRHHDERPVSHSTTACLRG